MLLISIVLSIGLATQFANSVLSPINEGKLRFIPQQELSVTQEVQDDSPSMSRLSMEGNQQIYPMLQQPIIQQPMMQQPMMQQPMMQQPIMQQPMMQGFNTPFSLNPINQQQLSLLLMSSYARIMALTQLMNMQDKSQLYQSNHYSDPTLNNYGPTPAQLPYDQQPQEDLQNNLKNEMLQQHQQAESEQQEILEQQRIQREYNMEIQRRKELLKRKRKENELEKQQQLVERQLRDEEEIKREREEAEKQILEEQRKEQKQKEEDLKLVQQEELKFQQNKEKKMKQMQGNMKFKPGVVKMKRNQF